MISPPERVKKSRYVTSKRIIDVVLSFGAIVTLTPLLLLVAVLLRLTGEGEIFFRQERVGLDGKSFALLKFATMLKDSPKTGDVTYEDDPRILPVGKWLRVTKINELPQLWNIFVGDMSVVGPRPLTPRAFAGYSPKVQDIVSKMKPGLTGIGSLVFRNEEVILARVSGDRMAYYREIILPLKGSLEAWYYANRSITLDMQLIVYTAIAVLASRSSLHLTIPGVRDLVCASVLAPELRAERRLS